MGPDHFLFLKETFVIVGHASAEGDYAQNLLLSQELAERLSRELVRRAMVFRAMVFRAMVFRAMVFRAMVFRAMVFRMR